MLEIHAGVVSAAGGCLMLPAAPGAGKSTLVAALIRSGFGFLSDEFAMLEPDTLRVHPVPLSLTVKPGSLPLLAPYYPGIENLVAHAREDEQLVRYLNPPGPSPDPEASYPVRWIVFPTQANGQDGQLRPLSRPEGLRRLMRECLTLPELLDRRGVESLVRWMREVECFELSVRPLPNAVERLQELALPTQ